MIKILPNTRFSNLYAKGSVQERSMLAQSINDKIFDSMVKLYGDKNNCKINLISQCYNSVLPENKNIKIYPIDKKEKKNTAGQVQIDLLNDCFCGYRIDILTNKKQRLNINNLPYFMHESAHLLDFLLNPKFIVIKKKMYERGLFDKDYYTKIFLDLFYNDEDYENSNKHDVLKRIETETKSILKDVPIEDKIVFLNYLKNELITEQNAYTQDYKYMVRLRNSVRNTKLDDYDNWLPYMYFSEKIEIVNNLLKEVILQERNKIASK